MPEALSGDPGTPPFPVLESKSPLPPPTSIQVQQSTLDLLVLETSLLRLGGAVLSGVGCRVHRYRSRPWGQVSKADLAGASGKGRSQLAQDKPPISTVSESGLQAEKTWRAGGKGLGGGGLGYLYPRDGPSSSLVSKRRREAKSLPLPRLLLNGFPIPQLKISFLGDFHAHPRIALLLPSRTLHLPLFSLLASVPDLPGPTVSQTINTILNGAKMNSEKVLIKDCKPPKMALGSPPPKAQAMVIQPSVLQVQALSLLMPQRKCLAPGAWERASGTSRAHPHDVQGGVGMLRPRGQWESPPYRFSPISS